MKKISFFLLALSLGFSQNACRKTDPPIENEVEVITDVILRFRNTQNPLDTLQVRAKDPDGPGVQAMQILDTIRLQANQTYDLSFEIWNELESPRYNVLTEILEEAEEHQIFFQFTENLFTSPLGSGNIPNRNGAVNYLDFDANNLPLGLQTRWTTGPSTINNAFFRVYLAHQPNVKTATSTYQDGDTDFDLRFVVEIQ